MDIDAVPAIDPEPMVQIETHCIRPLWLSVRDENGHLALSRVFDAALQQSRCHPAAAMRLRDRYPDKPCLRGLAEANTL
jgi:hypothetical protein